MNICNYEENEDDEHDYAHINILQWMTEATIDFSNSLLPVWKDVFQEALFTRHFSVDCTLSLPEIFLNYFFTLWKDKIPGRNL